MTKSKKKSGETAGKIALPESGLAEDILRQLEGGAGQDDAPVEKALSATAEQGPDDRVYRFADSLQDGAEVEDQDQEEAILETWVSFELAGEVYALPVSHVQEILRVSAITRVPHAPHPVRGVTNMRGRVLPVVDLRVRLGLETLKIDKRSRILVLGSRGRTIGLLVDVVQQVMRLDLRKVQEPPKDVMTAQSFYILGVFQEDEELVILLDADRVLLVQDEIGGEESK